ncbi:MAG: cellulase family glycosylhydrolase [Kiritimatiellae bacterium]|nr:cellulase family glycosylhydrolase [Kiritimatiellia bacterium]
MAEPVDSKPRDYPEDPTIEEAAPENWPLPLRVEGRWLRNSKDENVWLQGVAVPGLEISSIGHGCVHSVIVAIEEWNANVVRLPIKDEFWYGNGKGKANGDTPQSDGGKAYRAMVDAAVMAAANRGAYLVLDHHRYRAVKPEHIPFWVELAQRYSNHPAVLFDIINEPHGISWEVWRNGGPVYEKGKAPVDQAGFLSKEEQAEILKFESPGMQKMVVAIRETGATKVIVAGALDWAYDLSGILKGYALEDPSGNGIMYASHIYNWKKGWQKAFLDASEHYPILLGEVGADVQKMNFLPEDIQEDPYTWVPDMLGTIQKHQLHWTGWSFHSWATPRMILDWEYTPTPFWGAYAKRALAGEAFTVEHYR